MHGDVVDRVGIGEESGRDHFQIFQRGAILARFAVRAIQHVIRDVARFAGSVADDFLQDLDGVVEALRFNEDARKPELRTGLRRVQLAGLFEVGLAGGEISAQHFDLAQAAQRFRRRGHQRHRFEKQIFGGGRVFGVNRQQPAERNQRLAVFRVQDLDLVDQLARFFLAAAFQHHAR